ncbi:hypothetical protein N7512_000733 [Penicillium capsulatum]|nr:hypothetical protein N7512_000733 [Penicillium capsulatum]
MLRNVTAKSPNIRSTTQILRTLIRDRHIRPTARHYKALILAHSDNERGLPEAVRNLLEEMEKNGVTADSGTLHAALQVLAVHPDFLLRQEVLRKLRDRWLTLSPTGWHFVVVGLLREHQFELALEQIELMERKDIHVDNWLHSTLIYHLCDFKEFDEVYRLMRARVKQGHDMTSGLWLHVLTTASEALHYPTTRYVWRRRVDLGYLNPSADVCRNVLTVASRAGDIELANHVFRLSATAELPLDAQAYERLIETQVGAGDLPAAFHVLCAMHESGIAIRDGATRPVIDYMIVEKVDPRAAWQMLKHLKNSKRVVPLACAHLIAQFCETEARRDASVAEDAIGFYKDLHTLCPSGADVGLYNSLVRTCRYAGNRAAGMFLVKEMASLGVEPNGATFEALILMCLDARNYRSAYMYFQDLLKRQDSICPEALEEIRELCTKSVDEFALRLQYHPAIKAGEASEVPEQQQQQQQPPPPPPPPPTQRELLQTVTKTRGRKGNHVMPPVVRRQLISREDRIAWNKKRRQKKRRLQAISRRLDEQDSDAGLRIP